MYSKSYHSLFNDVERKQALDALKKKHFNIDIGIKRLLKIIGRSRLYMPPKSQTIWDYGIPNAQIKFGTDY